MPSFQALCLIQIIALLYTDTFLDDSPLSSQNHSLQQSLNISKLLVCGLKVAGTGMMSPIEYSEGDYDGQRPLSFALRVL